MDRQINKSDILYDSAVIVERKFIGRCVDWGWMEAHLGILEVVDSLRYPSSTVLTK
jgi:hypothetical protein